MERIKKTVKKSLLSDNFASFSQSALDEENGLHPLRVTYKGGIKTFNLTSKLSSKVYFLCCDEETHCT